MGLTEEEILEKERKREEEELRELRNRENYIIASVIEQAERESRKDIEDFNRRLDYFRDVITGKIDKKPEEVKELINKAIHKVVEERKEIEKEHVKSETRVNKIRDTRTDDQAGALKAQLVSAIFRFANTKDKKEAAKFAAIVRSDLNRILENEDIKASAALSPVFYQQAEKVVQMGQLIEHGMEALEKELRSGLDDVPVSEAEKNNRTKAIMAMEVLNLKDVLDVESPEMKPILDAQKKQAELDAERAKQKELQEEMKEIEDKPEVLKPEDNVVRPRVLKLNKNN